MSDLCGYEDIIVSGEVLRVLRLSVFCKPNSQKCFKFGLVLMGG